MSIELFAVAANALVLFALLSVQQLHHDFTRGLRWGLGNREEANESPLAQRIRRTIGNHIESAVIFAPLAVVVVVAEVSSGVSELGAVAFVAARAAYAVCYVAGVRGLRSVVWLASVAALWMVGWPIVTAAL